MCAQPEGRLEPSALPASFLSSVVLAGMLMTSQCHQPAPPVGASGSCTSSAKLFVASGAPAHPSAGEMFPPEQPKPLKTCSMAIGPFGRMSGLTSLNWARAALFFLAATRTSTRKSCGDDCSPPGRIYNALNLTY